MARRGSRQFSMDGAELLAGITAFGPRVDLAAGALMERSKDQAVTHMKVHAPWTDRTGNARSGLDGTVFKRGSGWVMNLFGRAPYQIWLEVKFHGRDAIIGPTILLWGPRTMAMFSGLINRLGGGA